MLAVLDGSGQGYDLDSENPKQYLYVAYNLPVLGFAICLPALVVHLINADGSDFVMPAHAGIQEHTALASGSASWIPGLALLAWNDATFVLSGKPTPNL